MALGSTKHSTILVSVTLLLLVVLSSSLAMNNIGAKSSEEEEQRKLINIPPFPPSKITVKINNDLGPGVWLAVHCKSKDDDLGSQTLAPEGSYEFFFKPNWLGSTLFFCHVEWPGTGNSRYFDAYTYLRDSERCRWDCCWNLKPDGPCDCYSGQCFPWNKP